MKILIENAKPIHESIWISSIPKNELHLLTEPENSDGPVSVILINDERYDDANHTLQFRATETKMLNLGTSDKTIFIGYNNSTARIPKTIDEVDQKSLSKGDAEFLRLVDQKLNDSAKSAAKLLLNRVRSKYPGDLKRGERNNFSNTPDNFWYVIVQPNKQNLSITVRGRPETFKDAELEIKTDRPGYTRFYISEPNDVEKAMWLIDRSKKK